MVTLDRKDRNAVAAGIDSIEKRVALIVGERSLRCEVVDSGAVEHTSGTSGVVRPGQGQGSVVRALIGDHLVAGGVVGLDEYGVAGTLAEPGIGRISGSPGRKRCSDGGQSECDPGTNARFLILFMADPSGWWV
jgi:hypothetical protein